MEFARTQVLDRPVHGRIFFEEVLRENLDLGRRRRADRSETPSRRLTQKLDSNTTGVFL
jgi:hypothetical protein